jgi:hypothetical protein
MLVSEQKPLEEILSFLNGERNIFLVGCNGCAEASGTGGPKQVREMKGRLEEAGKNITGWTVLDFLCQRALIKTGLKPFEPQVMTADSLLVLCCGVGIQTTAAVVPKAAHPACNTVSLGGAYGEWRGSERCQECGQCFLDLTGGICPLTACSKGLLNGPCGGAQDGRCEVEPDLRPCGWILIYERLQALERLDVLRDAPVQIADRGKMQPPRELRESVLYALEQRP